MSEPRANAELITYAARAAVATHIQYDAAGASKKQSFDAAVTAWLSICAENSRPEACEMVLALLIEMHAAALAVRH